MISMNLKPVLLSLCLSASLVGAAAHAQASKPAPAANAKVLAAAQVSMLGGKLSFTAPAGYEASDLPVGNSKNGTAGATGRIYVNKEAKRAIITTEAPVATPASDNDNALLAGAVAGFVKQQQQSLPDYKKTGEQSFAVKGLGVRQLDSTVTMGGVPAHNTTFLAGSGKQLAVIQVLTNQADDGHDALVEQVKQSMQAK